MTNDSGVGEPFSVRFDSCLRNLSTLEGSSFGNLSSSVSLCLSILEHIQGLDLLRRAVEYLSQQAPWQSNAPDIPIEVLALGLDIGHAIADLALTDLPRTFFLKGTHLESDCAVRCCVGCGMWMLEGI